MHVYRHVYVWARHGDGKKRPTGPMCAALCERMVLAGSISWGKLKLTMSDSELTLSPTGALAPHAGLSASYALQQRLQAEGDEALLFGVASLGDGTSQLVPHAQLNVSTPSSPAYVTTPNRLARSPSAVSDCVST